MMVSLTKKVIAKCCPTLIYIHDCVTCTESDCQMLSYFNKDSLLRHLTQLSMLKECYQRLIVYFAKKYICWTVIVACVIYQIQSICIKSDKRTKMQPATKRYRQT